MPYSDQWGITITKTGTGVYAVSRLGVSGSVRINHVFPNPQESINVAAALARGCEFMAHEREGVGDGNLASLWRGRARYSWARWKLLAYQRLINTSTGALQAAFQEKRAPWVTEEQAVAAELGADA